MQCSNHRIQRKTKKKQTRNDKEIQEERAKEMKLGRNKV